MAGGIVKCTLCPRYCRLAPDQRGDCRSRYNREGKLVTLVYGKPNAVHVDPIEKKPMNHFLPGTPIFSIATAGCNLHCLFCQNWEISQANPEDTHNIDLPPEKVVSYARNHGCRSIAYTYSEPNIFYEYVYDTAMLAHQAGLKNVMVTAGYINREPLKELCRYIDGANVDLKGFTEEYYREVCFGHLKPVLDALVTYRECGVLVEVTTLIVPTLNDDMKVLGEMCRWIKANLGADTPIHFSRFHPQHKLRSLYPTPAATLEAAYDTARSVGMNYVYVGNIPGHEGEDTFCSNCHRLLIERTGYRVGQYHVVDGKCRYCRHAIHGVWM